MAKMGGGILRRELLPKFFTNSHEIWHRCLPWGVDVQDTFFDSGRKCVAMVTAYYGKNWGKILRRELLPQFFTNSHEIWHRCLPLGVDVQDTFFDSGRKCVAMVTAYYTVKKYCGAGVLITFSDISSYFSSALLAPPHPLFLHLSLSLLTLNFEAISLFLPLPSSHHLSISLFISSVEAFYHPDISLTLSHLPSDPLIHSLGLALPLCLLPTWKLTPFQL